MISRPWWQILLMIGGIIVLGLFSAAIGLRWVIKGGEVTVPELEKQNVVKVLRRLNSLGLRLEIEGQEFHPQIPASHIISQRPAGGSLIKTGRKVRVVLSKGSQQVQTPSLTGKSWYQAQTTLRKKGLDVGLLSRVHTADPPQQILGQFPAAGVAIQRGGRVNLLISQGTAPDFYLMPDFIGRQLPLVRRRLKRMKLSLGKVTHKAYQGLAPETVINQFPAAGFRIRQGKLVDLVVSRGE